MSVEYFAFYVGYRADGRLYFLLQPLAAGSAVVVSWV